MKTRFYQILITNRLLVNLMKEVDEELIGLQNDGNVILDVNYFKQSNEDQVAIIKYTYTTEETKKREPIDQIDYSILGKVFNQIADIKKYNLSWGHLSRALDNALDRCDITMEQYKEYCVTNKEDLITSKQAKI